MVRSMLPRRRRSGRPSNERTVARSSAPFFHVRSISNPPRALKPVTRPSGHAAGSAGRRRISPASHCNSISAIADVPPKLPSI